MIHPRWLYLLGGKRLESFRLDAVLTNNNDGRTRTYHESARQKKEFYLLLRSVCRRREPYHEPVMVFFNRVLGKGEQTWDHDSRMRGNCKELLDAMVSAGWFVDDSPKYISHFDVLQDSSRRTEGPSIYVHIWSNCMEMVDYD